MRQWDEGWAIMFTALEPLTAVDMGRIVLIRNQPHTVVQAINRQLTHYGEHTGQIVLLAKHFRAGQWKSLSIPRGKSAEFNRAMAARNETSGETKL